MRNNEDQMPPEITPEMVQEMKDAEDEQKEDMSDENYMQQNEYPQGYGLQERESSFNQHTFLANSLSQDMPEKVTFLEKGELGVPAFTIRFMQDMEDIAKFYLDPIIEKYCEPGTINKCSDYFRQKIINVCHSGMSNNGFIQGLNVTKRMDMQRSRKNNIQNLKGGIKR